jgi:hypothetical protein
VVKSLDAVHDGDFVQALIALAMSVASLVFGWWMIRTSSWQELGHRATIHETYRIANSRPWHLVRPCRSRLSSGPLREPTYWRGMVWPVETAAGNGAT